MYETILHCPVEHRLLADDVIADRDRLREENAALRDERNKLAIWIEAHVPGGAEVLLDHGIVVT